jgi:hypothetical protein
MSSDAERRAPIEPDEFGAFMEAVCRHNLVLKLDVILGLPFETFDSYFAGLDLLLPYFQGTDHILNIHRLQILPGSELEELSDDYGIEYPRIAPHTVRATATFTREEMKRASRLTGVLFRALNSPLRSRFFEAFHRSHGRALHVAELMLEAIESSETLHNTSLGLDENVDDDYWNDAVYREVPSEWLARELAMIKA